MEMIGYHVNERICAWSDLNDIDDELPLLNDLRKTFMPRYYYNIIRMFKLVEWLKSENRNVLIKCCNFIKL